MEHKLDFFTQYGQFYIADKDGDKDMGNDFWNELSHKNRLAISDGILGVAIENDECTAKVEISVLDSAPTISSEKTDHIVEGSLEIKSGFLQIQDCPTSTVELEIPLEPGSYRCRIYSYNLDLAYEEEPKDQYKIEIWRQKHSPAEVLKQWYPNY